MVTAPAGPLHAFLAGTGRDARGRTLETVLALPDDALEQIHDYIQWLFPLPVPSRAQPHSPVLTPAEAAAIRADPAALASLRRAADRMTAFYRDTGHWLTRHDHNHLRISRILQSLRLLAGIEDARAFHRAVSARHEAAGAPIDPRNLRHWTAALDDPA